MYGREWNEAEERAELHLMTLAARLDARFGPHRTLVMRPTGVVHPEPFRTLVAKDCLGDLRLWGPLPSGRWAALSLNQSDGDAPMILTALVTDRPLTRPPDPAS
ncbi:hypothetical protein SHKM778_13340 [Streptomyces sp. KM77-8]|uniref:Uncharacterized protein n=1 Tax=Streptomyces haneummycinicus TaxID=3074435 RepID=A0AAT9HC30_9ACTN